MKTEQEVREKIRKTTEQYQHVLDGGRASLLVNAPRALIQIEAITALNYLYWILSEKRPQFDYDTKEQDT